MTGAGGASPGPGPGGRTPRDLVMPRLGLTMKQGRVTRWYRGPGEAFRRGEPLVQVTTEKVAVDVEAAYDGVLVEVLVPEGKTVPVGRPIARVEAEAAAAGDAWAGPARAPSAEPWAAAGVGTGVESSAMAGVVTGATRGAETGSIPGSGTGATRGPETGAARDSATGSAAGPPPGVRATPAAKRVARETGVDLTRVAGTGPEGRVTEEDVRAFALSQARDEDAARVDIGLGRDEVTPHSDWRAAVARNMAASARATAPVTLHRRVAFTLAAALLEDPRARRAGAGPLDIIIKAVADTLAETPDLNATFTEEALVRHRDVNIGAALALPEGLLVPVLRRADRLSLLELAGRRRALWARAREGRPTQDDLTGGTFTVTNLGPFGVEGFTPIINLPEVAVLGVGRIAPRPVAQGDQVIARLTVDLSLTFDHRAVDGAPAAAFLDRVAARVTDPPSAWLAEAAGARRARRVSSPGAFDLVIVGAGPGGFAAATTAAQLGARVALVESGQVGGVCLNRGCIPTKAALEMLARRGERPAADAGAASLQEAVEGAVSAIRAGAEDALRELGVDVIRGHARLEVGEPGGSPRVNAGGRVLAGTGVILAAGSEPVALELPPGLVRTGGEVIAVEDLLTRDRAAGRALVVGGGPGGVEASRILALAGSRVTLVEKLPSLLPGEEDDVGELIRLGLESLGVEVLTGIDVTALPGGREGFDLAVLAVGRRARVGGLGLENLRAPGSVPEGSVAPGSVPEGSVASGSVVEGPGAPGQAVPGSAAPDRAALLDEGGFVRVDSRLRTSLPGLYAVGDVTGPPFWAHRASEQGRVAALNILAGIEGFPDRNLPKAGPAPELVPRVVFTDPEFGAVGLGRSAAEAAGREVIVGVASMGGSARAGATGKGEGFVRVVAERHTGRLLGLQAVCPGATELVSAGLVALAAGLGVEALAGLPFAHPTYAESLGDAARDAVRQLRS